LGIDSKVHEERVRCSVTVVESELTSFVVFDDERNGAARKADVSACSTRWLRQRIWGWVGVARREKAERKGNGHFSLVRPFDLRRVHPVAHHRALYDKFVVVARSIRNGVRHVWGVENAREGEARKEGRVVEEQREW
jgi:hypothetical protein